MSDYATITYAEFKRWGYTFNPGGVRKLIPSGAVGTYMSMCDNVPIYIGRSDHCLRSRLADHWLLKVATHFVWEICSTPRQSYYLESFLFHKLQATPNILNVIHPAKPVGSQQRCPFCLPREQEAWERASHVWRWTSYTES